MRVVQREPDAVTLAEIDEALMHVAEAKARGDYAPDYADWLLDERRKLTA